MLIINYFPSIFISQPEQSCINCADGRKICEYLNADWNNSVIFVNGFKKDKNYVLNDGDVCTVRVFPANHTKVGDALGITNTWFGNKLTDFSKWVGAGFRYHLKNWLGIEDPESPSNKDNSLQSIPTLSGAKNQSGYGKAIPIVIGRHLLTPYYCGSPYHTISGTDGEKQTFHALYMLGYNDIQVTDIKLGVVDLAHNQNYIKDKQTVTVPTVDDGIIEINGRWEGSDYNIKLELRQGRNDDSGSYYNEYGECFFYPQKVIDESLGIELLHTSDDKEVLELDRFSAKNPQRIEIELTLQGLIGYEDDGKEKEKSVSVQLEISFDGGDTYEPFNTSDTTGQENVTCDSNGIYTITRKKNKVMRFAMTRTLSYDEAVNCKNRIAELRIKRTNAKDSSTNTADSVYLSAIRTWSYDYTKTIKDGLKLIPQAPVIESRRDITARLAFQIDANEIDFKNQIEALNCIVAAKGKVWDGDSWSETTEVNSNPASMALRILEHPSRGKYAYGKDNEPNRLHKLDYESFGEFYEWCNLPRSENDSTPKFQCDGILTSTKKTSEIIRAILDTARAKLILNDKRYGIWIDKQRNTPVMILNNQNIISASNTKSFEDLPDGYKIKFVNRITWQSDEIKVMFDQAKAEQPGMTFEKIELLFQTDAKQVFQNGKYLLACAKLRPETWNRKVSVDGNLLDIGSKVEIQDSSISVGIGDGAEVKDLIIDGNYITGIKTDGKFIVTELGHRFGIRCTVADGINTPRIVAWEVRLEHSGVQNDLYFISPILNVSSSLKPNIGDIISFGIYEEETTEALCFGKKDNGDGTFDLTLVPYQSGIYTADKDDVSIDDLDFDSKVTDIQMNTGGNIPDNVPIAYPTFEQVKGMAQSYASQLRILTSLLDTGYDGEIAVYYGAFFKYSSSDSMWKRIDKSSYLGALSVFPTEPVMDSFFLALFNSTLPDEPLVLSDGTNLMLSDGTDLVVCLKTERGTIYAFTDDGWRAVTDRNDYRYIMAFNDLVAYGFELPESYESFLKTMAADNSPRYLGALYHEPYQYKEGDWFCWAGETTASREKGRIYKLMKINGELAWVKLDENDTANHAEFMAALSDILLLHNAEPGYFSTIFANALIAHEVFTNRLEVVGNTAQSNAEKYADGIGETAYTNAKKEAIEAASKDATSKANTAETNAVTTATGQRNEMAQKLGYSSYDDMVSAASAGKTIVDGGYLRTLLIKVVDLLAQNIVLSQNGYIQSSNYAESNGVPTAGFKIDAANNRIMAVDGVFGGEINAKEGVLQSVTILGDSTFSGNIFSGPLELSTTTPSGATITILAGYTRMTGYRLSHGVGTYKGFSFIEMWISTANDLDETGDYAKLNLYNGSDYYTEKGEKGTGRLPDKVLFKFTDTLTFQYAVASDAKTFKLKNLPTVKPSESGTV